MVVKSDQEFVFAWHLASLGAWLTKLAGISLALDMGYLCLFKDRKKKQQVISTPPADVLWLSDTYLTQLLSMVL